MTKSKQIEQAIWQIEEWSEKEYGACPGIHVHEDNGVYEIILSYSSDTKDIEETVCCGMFFDEIIHFMEDGELRNCIRNIYDYENGGVGMMMKGANRFMFFSWNYTYQDKPYKFKNAGGKTIQLCLPRFLAQVEWTCNMEHMISKWRKATKTGDPHSYMSHFYGELDGENRRRFLEWVMDNYKDEINF